MFFYISMYIFIYIYIYYMCFIYYYVYIYRKKRLKSFNMSKINIILLFLKIIIKTIEND